MRRRRRRRRRIIKEAENAVVSVGSRTNHYII
jgi:hypothetical protein